MKYVIPLLIISTTAFAQQAQQPVCGGVKEAYTYLVNKYGEHPMIEMTDASGRHLVIFTNPNTKTWTVLQIAGEKSCAIASGEDLTPSDYKAMDEKYLDKGPPV